MSTFETRLTRAVFWEEKLSPRMRRKASEFPWWVRRVVEINGMDMTHNDYDTDPEPQKNGIDSSLDIGEINFDYKTRDHCWYDQFDILVDHWVQNEDTDIIVYCWEADNGCNLVDGVLLILSDEFRSWLDDNRERFDSKPDGIAVDIDEIPDKHICTEFDPSFAEDFTPSEMPPSF